MPRELHFDQLKAVIVEDHRPACGRVLENPEFLRFLAWLTWLFIHLIYLIECENRLLVLIQWANHYITRWRGVRLITQEGEAGSAEQVLANGEQRTVKGEG